MTRKNLTEAVEAGREEHELEALVEVLGDAPAQDAAEHHALTELIWEVQH